MLVTALLVKNEADKYLERVLTRCLEFSDHVLVLDDGSTDGSERIAWRLGCEVRQRAETGMWGNEAPARAELWDWGAEVAGDGWLLICDADMILRGNPRPLTLSTQHNAWAFPLYDLWDDEKSFRCDGFWQGHRHPRAWLFKPSALGYDVPEWNPRGLHVGHCPHNARLNVGVDPMGTLFYEHLSFLRRGDRLKKVQQYQGQAHHLTPWELAHAESVGD